LRFFRRQLVQILVHGIARVDLVLDAVQASHQQRREAQVRVGTRIREARLDTTAFRVLDERDTDRGRTVAGRVGQHDRRFVARHQTLVGVGQRVGDRVQRAGMLDDAADVVDRHFRQAAVRVAAEQVLAVLAQGLVYVHPGAVVTDDRLRHEGSGLAVGMGNVVYAVLEDLYFVGLLGQGVGANADFTLASGRHFVVVYFHVQAHLGHGGTHGSTQVVQAVYRRHREVAALDARTVTDVVAVEIFAGNPGGFVGVDFVHLAVHAGVPLDTVEHKEFRLRPEQRGVGDAGGLQVFLGAHGNGTRVTVVALHGGRLNDVAAHDHGGHVGERVHHGGGVVRHQHHVGFVDALPAGDRRTVEHLAVLEEAIVDIGCRVGNVLFLA